MLIDTLGQLVFMACIPKMWPISAKPPVGNQANKRRPLSKVR